MSITTSEMVRLRALIQIVISHAQPVTGSFSASQILPVYTADGYDWPRLVGRLLLRHFGATRALQSLTVEPDESEQQRVIEYLALSNWAAEAAHAAVLSNKKAGALRGPLERLIAALAAQTQMILSIVETDELGLPHIADGVKLAALTGLRRADLVSLTWDEILPHSIKKKAAKISKGKRRFAVIPRIPELDTHLEHLRRRMRKSGVNNVLVNSRGMAWSGDGFGTTFNRVRDHAGIVHVDQETGKNAAMHIHDLRGTFCTKLLRAGLTNEEVAEIMGWAPDQVAGIRRSYVDQSAIVRAIGERIRGAV